MNYQETFNVAAPAQDPSSTRRSDQATFAAAIQICERDSSPAARRCAEIFREWFSRSSYAQPAPHIPVRIELNGVEEGFSPVPV